MVQGLTGYCPALPRLRYAPHRVSRDNALPKVLGLLESHQVLVVSGTSHHYFDTNKQIGKTYLLRRGLFPEMQRRGQTIGFIDVYDLVGSEAVLFYLLDPQERFDKALASLPEADVYIFDEIHHALPPKEPSRLFTAAFPQFNECLMSFWNKVESYRQSGKKIIFSTALHPLNERYADFLYNPTIAELLTAPVVELEAN